MKMMKVEVTLVGLVLALVATTIGADWSVRRSEDVMSGKISFYASSEAVRAERAMAFPYQSVRGSLTVGCSQGSRRWVYFWFSEAPPKNVRADSGLG